MLETLSPISAQVCHRVSPRMSFPHAFAFLDGTPSPKSIKDLHRLVRLMAYDIVSIHGSRGADPAGVYAWCLRALHHFVGHGAPGWEWKWGAFHFRAWPCAEEKFGTESFHMESRQEEKLHELREWTVLLENGNVPLAWVGGREDASDYPDPKDTIQAACLMVIDAAQCLFGPDRVSVWLQNTDKECLMMELWSEKTSKYSYLER